MATLTALEESLWRPATRGDRAHVEAVFADDFDEFGASGRHWTRRESIGMAVGAFEIVLPLPDLRMRPLGEDAVLLTYRSVVSRPGEEAPAVANRSSVWQRIDGRWRLRFHQGTPAT